MKGAELPVRASISPPLLRKSRSSVPGRGIRDLTLTGCVLRADGLVGDQVDGLLAGGSSVGRLVGRYLGEGTLKRIGERGRREDGLWCGLSGGRRAAGRED